MATLRVSQRTLLREQEKGFMWAIYELGALHGWTVAHFRPAHEGPAYRTPVAFDGAGFPDLVLARDGDGVIFAEVKTDVGKMSPAQRAWRAVLQDCPGVEYYCWKPQDWPAIEERLTWPPRTPIPV
jgi:hypothetical protein